MERILITGAAGQIGKALRSGLRGSYPLIRLLDVAPLGSAEKGEEVLTADIRDAAAMGGSNVRSEDPLIRTILSVRPPPPRNDGSRRPVWG
jgi:nucleoside-diphosphate-sugar epimerase